MSASGNITAVNFIGNVVGNITGTLTAPGANTEIIFNSNGIAAASSALTFNGSLLQVTGNVSATAFSGSGAALTAITGANVTGIVAQATVAGTANTVAGANVTGIVAQATVAGTANSVAGANVTGTVPAATIAATVTTAAQPNITSVGTLSSLSVTGNVNTNGFFIGNGSQLTGVNTVTNSIINGPTNITIPTSGGNANISVGGFSNVVVVAPNFTTLTGVLSVSGNVQTATGYVVANDVVSTGSFSTVRANVSGSANVTGTVTAGNLSTGGNATVGGQLSVTGAVNAGTLSLTGNVTSSINGSGFITSALGLFGPSISVSGNVIGGNVTTAGQISATGNISAGNLIAVSGVTASGNVVAANFIGGGAGTPQLISSTSLILGAVTVVQVTGSPFRLASLTTTQRNALTAVNGDLIYNSTLNKFQGYENGAWANII
jgi:hypothetical protein